MDIIDRHFAAENAHDVEATLETYTDDVVWDDVTHPLCPVQGKAAAGEIYTSILDAIPDIHLESVLRFSSADRVVDEAILTGSAPPTLMIDGVVVETPSTTIDEARAPQVIAARVKPSTPSTRIDIETVPLPNKPVALAPVD